MPDIALPIIAGFAVGCLHAFDADHIAAVSVFVSRNPKPKSAAMFGLHWAIGHTTTLFLFGMTAMTLKIVITPTMEAAAEIGVGMMLILLGTWGIHHLVRRERIHIHRHTHDGVEHIHFHSHADRPDHGHAHSMFLVGAAHGLAGTASVLVVIPIAVVSSVVTTSLYILVFGIGTMVAMSVFAYLLGNVMLVVKRKNTLLWLQGMAGAVSIIIGFLWIFQRVM